MGKPPRESSPYESFDQQNFLLRDYLAMDRTALANERTLLAYVRTALALMIVGGTMLHFFESLVLDVIGSAFIAVGIMTAAVGGVRFRRIQLILTRIKKRPESARTPPEIKPPAAHDDPNLSRASEEP